MTIHWRSDATDSRTLCGVRGTGAGSGRPATCKVCKSLTHCDCCGRPAPKRTTREIDGWRWCAKCLKETA